MSGFQLTGARIPGAGGRVTGDACEVRVFEPEDVDILGPCRGFPPSINRPCEVQVTVRDDSGPATVEGEVHCDGVEVRGRVLEGRDIVSDGSPFEPASFVVSGCPSD